MTFGQLMTLAEQHRIAHNAPQQQQPADTGGMGLMAMAAMPLG